MSAQKHTPGPWRVGQIAQTVVADSADGTHAAHGEIEYYGAPLVCESVSSSANAHLIAAAPELLAACESSLAMVETNQGPPDWDAMRAAIAKARGEQP